MKISTIIIDRSKWCKAFAVVFWLIVWQIGAMALNQSILLVSPIKVAQRLTQIVFEATFWKSIVFSTSRILLGFAISVTSAIILSTLSHRSPFLRAMLAPLLSAIRSIPVASFVILALLWVTGKELSILISFLIGFPILYGQLLAGFDAVDPKMLEMAKVFHIPFYRQLGSFYLSTLIPYFHSSLATAMGLCWKSGIAAEVIGIPNGSIGEKLYKAKIFLETPDLFCWTVVIVLISSLCCKGISILFKGLERSWNHA